MAIQGFKGAQGVENTIKQIDSGVSKTEEIIKNVNNAETEEMNFDDIKEAFESVHPKENEEIIALKEEGYNPVFDNNYEVTIGDSDKTEQVKGIVLANKNGETETIVLMVNEETNTYERVEVPELENMLDAIANQYMKEYQIKQMNEDARNSIFNIN